MVSSETGGYDTPDLYEEKEGRSEKKRDHEIPSHSLKEKRGEKNSLQKEEMPQYSKRIR